MLEEVSRYVLNRESDDFRYNSFKIDSLMKVKNHFYGVYSDPILICSLIFYLGYINYYAKDFVCIIAGISHSILINSGVLIIFIFFCMRK